jgi:hypothetical protein
MRLVPVFLAIAAVAGGPAAAQEAKLTIQPGHTAVIQQYVTTEHIPTSAIKMRVEVGSTIPDGIQLRPVPLGMVAKVPEVRNYEYFVADGGKIVFVEPYTRMVVQIVQ